MKKSVNRFAIPALSVLMSIGLLASSSQASIVSLMSPALISDAVFNGLGAVSVITASGAYFGDYYSNHKSTLTLPLVKAFVATLIIGLALDDSGNQKVVLKPVSDEVAKDAGLSAQEAHAYNEELEVAQQVFDQVGADVISASEQDRVAVAKASWEKYRGMLSDDAFSGLFKLGQTYQYQQFN